MPLPALDSPSGSSLSVNSDCNGSLTSDNGERLSVATQGGHTTDGSYYDDDADRCANCTDDGRSTGGSLHGSTSLAPSICQHSYRFGRRYQTYRDGRYVLPNDDAEQQREEMKHHMMLEVTDGRHILAPIPDDVENIIDLGTGTALWPLDVADLYPNANIVGVDLSPIQPSYVPPNVNFYIDDIEDDWIGDTVYDYIHTRYLCSFIADSASLIRRSFSNLKPGGWMELQELDHIIHCDDNSVPDDYPVRQYCKITTQMSNKKLGIDIEVAPKLGKMMEDAGFTDIRCVKHKVPIGGWVRERGKEKKYRSLGEYLKYIVDWVIAPMSALNAQGMGWSEEETEEFVKKCHVALHDPSYHSYMYIYIWMGQKPQDSVE